MLISWNWLSQYVDLTGLEPEIVGEQFTLKVAELDGVNRIGHGLSGVRTAKIMEVESHPNAEKLTIVKVDDGQSEHVVVCGAPNVRTAVGAVVAWVSPGAVLPDGKEIDFAEIRGVRSAGMLASEAELGLSEDHDGILLMPSDTPIGLPLPRAMPVEDAVWEVDNKAITHRADLWGHYGVAREVGMLTGRELKAQELDFSFGDREPIELDTNMPPACRRYLTTRVDNVVVEPSPVWLQRLLIASGIRPVSNVVDVTNFVMLETGNPLHAFDARDLIGGRLSVTCAHGEHEVETLDGQTRIVPSGALLICDGEQAVAIAGIMGCGNSQIRPDTTSVVLEAANFEAESVRKTSLAMGLRTDSSARFEKALAPDMCKVAAIRFCQILKLICPDASFDFQLLDHFPNPPRPVSIELSLSYASQRLGVSLDAKTVLGIFDALGLDSSRSDDLITVSVPFWRAGRDLNHAEDLIEELGRSIGYYAIEPKAPNVELSRPTLRASKVQERTARRVFSLSGGYFESLSYAFAHGPTLARLGVTSVDALVLANPISADWTSMRRSLIPNLLKAAEENARFESELKLFELGRVFEPVKEGVGPQPRRMGWLSMHAGQPEPKERHLVAQRDLVLSLLSAIGCKNVCFRSGVDGFDYESAWLHPVRSLTFLVNGESVGYLGSLHPRVAQSFSSLNRELWIGELDLDRLPTQFEGESLFKCLPRYPSIPFDLSLETEVAVRSSELVSVVNDHFNGCPIFEGVRLFSVYFIDEHRKSLSLRLTFRSEKNSLTDEDVNPLIDELLDHLEKNHNVSLRSE